MMNQPMMWYQPGYFELSVFEMILTGFLLLSVFIKKDKLVMAGLGAKIIIHELVLADLFWKCFPWKISLSMFSPAILKQILYILILIWMIRCEKKKQYKKAGLGIGIIFCMELLSSFIYYPSFMDYFYNVCRECNKNLSWRMSLWFTSVIASAPFTQIKNRLLTTLAEVIVFLVQYLLHRKDKI